MNVLIINSGSSSIKYQVIDMGTETVLAVGLVERIGEGVGRLKNTVRPETDAHETVLEQPIADHRQGMELAIGLLTDPAICSLDGSPIAGIDEDGCNGPYFVAEDANIARCYLTLEFSAIGKFR